MNNCDLFSLLSFNFLRKLTLLKIKGNIYRAFCRLVFFFFPWNHISVFICLIHQKCNIIKKCILFCIYITLLPIG